MSGFAQKTAIITGGATSIGAAIVHAFHSANANVVIADIDAHAGPALADELGARALFCRTDITADEQIDACIQAAHVKFGGVDILVNNACIYLDSGFSSTRENWLHAFNTNVVGGAIFSQRVAEQMKSRGGAIVNLASVAGKFGQAGRALYPVCKAAILQLTRNQAAEWAPHNVRVNSVSPGWTHSPALNRLSNGDSAHADRAAAALHPLGRVGRAEEVAQAVLYLCSDAATFVTGVDLPVDGGYAMLGPDQGNSARYWFEHIE